MSFVLTADIFELLFFILSHAKWDFSECGFRCAKTAPSAYYNVANSAEELVTPLAPGVIRG